jgi:hypothetical protein
VAVLGVELGVAVLGVGVLHPNNVHSTQASRAEL